MEWLHLDCDAILKITDRAILVRVVDGRELWLPKSVVADAEDYKEMQGTITVSVAMWFNC